MKKFRIRKHRSIGRWVLTYGVVECASVLASHDTFAECVMAMDHFRRAHRRNLFRGAFDR